MVLACLLLDKTGIKPVQTKDLRKTEIISQLEFQMQKEEHLHIEHDALMLHLKV